MRQGQDARPARACENLPPTGHGAGESVPEIAAEMPALRVLPDREDELETGQRLEQGLAPLFGAFAAGRELAALRILAREARPHRHDCDAGRIIEGRLVEAEPGAQANAGGVREGPA